MSASYLVAGVAFDKPEVAPLLLGNQAADLIEVAAVTGCEIVETDYALPEPE